jgi:glutaredoxin 2
MGREEVRELTGSPVVPVLITDDGEAIGESARIVEWADAHPASA